ncbi:MAG: hypothetical protein CMC74_02730 [Flavobacteriaceae bacterium]|nr:hypothetical protein [Flavobacteriaceae bacterium]|tara:strand:+ start:3410 stop:4846 length:1437 start_codon:yes stop_codon:yes gene_type:complete
MEKVKTNCIQENQITNNLYKVDDQFEDFLKSIELDGILEPLIIQPLNDKEGEYEVVSGNRRLRAARELNLKEVPVVIQETKLLSEELSIAHQQYREKKPSEILREVLNIKERYGLKQGVRSDLNPKVKKGQELKKKMVKKHSKTKIDKLVKIDKYLKVLSKDDPTVYDNELHRLDKSGSIDGTRKRLEKKVKESENRKKVGDTFEIIREKIKVYQKSSENLSEINDNSVAAIVTSPPYYDVRDYKLGKNQLGHDLSADDFVNRLVSHFDDCKRVLRKNGTMWVVIGDYVKDYGYTAVAEKFLVKMLENGWILHDKIIWVKNNPVYTSSNRCVLANEFIYVFKKNKFVHYDESWVKNHQENIGFVKLGNEKLKSVFDFRDNIVKTNVANNYSLRKECEKKGFNLTHDATFPISIPSIAIMTSSKPGDLILDPFNGTGTTGQSTLHLGRKYIGYELNPTFIKQTEIRIDMPFEDDLEIAA